MKNFYIIIVFLIFGKIVAAPTVTVAPLSGVQDVNSTNSVVYFQVNFSEPVAGFTGSDVVVYGSANPIKAFIKPKDLIIAETQNFIVGVVGMNAIGTVSIFIPSNAAGSLSEGIGNVVSNDATVNYSFPLLGFSIHVGSTINYSMNNFFTKFHFYPSSQCNTQTITFSTEGIASNQYGLRYVNNTSSGVCVDVKVYKLGTFCPEFNVYKDFLPTNSTEQVTQWIAGEAFTDYQYVRNGHTYRTASFFVNPGQTFYVMANSLDTEFFIQVNNLPLSSLNYLSIDENSTKNKVKIYPNPVKDFLNIDAKNIDWIKIYDVSGKLVKTFSKQSKINISELPKGNYLTEISENGKISKQKFIKY